ncbi:uncharacterized protein LOC126662054 [Mercurialis annua]|uniref:uncharacterized protein LOC126662054 n=1 Tax=Mercurialis annua TaxID=3986 RepID=UPI0024AFC85E|nr:uncharacterized protein LOC126662054 [Mercurialis annua]
MNCLLQKSPIKKKVIKSAASTKRKASIKTSEHEEVQEEKSMKAYKTRATSSSGKKQVSTETSESEKVVDDVSIKAPKTRSTPGSSKKKSYTESTESEKVLDDGSIKIWSPRWKLGDIPTTRVDHCLKYNVVDQLRSNLSEGQLELFKQTCFGFVLEMPPCLFQGQVIHSLLARQLIHPKQNEMWFGVGEHKVRFSIEEFAVLTGLNCTGEIQKVGFEDSGNSFVDKYFFGKTKVNMQSVIECLLSKRWQSDEDAVRIAFLYVLEIYFLSALDSNLVDGHHLDVIAFEDYNCYPWGKEIFSYTLNSLKTKDLLKKTKKEGYCRLLGFPIILQYLFYECFPSVDGKICMLVGNKVPRCLNWTSSKTPAVIDLETDFYNHGSKLKFERIVPSADEKRVLMLNGFFASEKKKGSIQKAHTADDDDLAAVNDANDHSFSSASTQNQQHINSLSKRVGNIEKQLKSVILQQSEIKKDLKSYHDDIDNGMIEIQVVLKDLVTKMDRYIEKSEIIKRVDDKDDRGRKSDSSSKSDDDNQNKDNDLNKAEDLSALDNDQEEEDKSVQGGERKIEEATNDVSGVDVDTNLNMNEGEDVFLTDSQLTQLDEQVASHCRSRDLASGSQASGHTDRIVFPYNEAPCPLLDIEYTELDAFRDLDTFNWIEQGWNKKTCSLTGKYAVITPPFDIGGDLITKKIFFHTLNFCGGELSTSHIDVIFYYLRKKIKLLFDNKMKFCTTDSIFSQILLAEYFSYVASGCAEFKVTSGNTILEYYKGGGCRYNKSWLEVNELLCPVIILDPNHWFLVRVNFEECKVYVYNSYKTEKIEANIEKMIGAFTHYLPVFLKQMNFYSSRNDSVSFALSSSFDSRYSPFSYENVAEVPVQIKSDCGAFTCLFAEYLIHGKPITSSFSMDEMERYRNRLCQGLISYAKWKLETDYKSDVEGTVQLRRELRRNNIS